MKLRPYQLDAKNFVYNSWKNGLKKVLILLATGSGKTWIAKSIIEDALKKDYRILFTTPRIVLTDKTFNDFIDLSPSIILGDDKRFDRSKNLQVGSLMSIKNRDILEPKIIIIDEVHVGFKADMIQDLIKRFPNAYIIGLSATPIDSKGYLLDGFDAYFDKYQIKELTEMKYLSPFKCYSPISIDLSSVNIENTGDYNQSELEKIVIEEKLLKTVVDNYKKYGEDKKFIAFSTTQKHGKMINDIFQKNNIETSYIDANTSKKERNIILDRFKDNDIKGLVNIGVLVAGFDMPDVSCIIDAAPTQRLSRYLQKIGRGSRISPDKEYCIYLDLGNSIETHDMPDIRRKFEFEPKISKVIDKKLNLTEDIVERNEVTKKISSEKFVQLKKIGKLLDIYDGKVYTAEKDLQSDVNKFLNKTGLFWYRQNSGTAQYGYALSQEMKAFAISNSGIDLSPISRFVAFITKGKPRFVSYTSKAGLADNSVFFNLGSVFFGIELKLKRGKLTPHQQKTIPEMIRKNVLIFFAESVFDVYEIIEHIQNNVDIKDNGIFIDDNIFNYSDTQKKYFKKHKIELYNGGK